MLSSPARLVSITAFICLVPGLVLAGGARHFKSGCVQLSGDGRDLWIANELADEVAKMDTFTEDFERFLQGSGCGPLSLSVSENGTRTWVACGLSDELLVINARGELLSRVPLTPGSRPQAIAVSPDGSRVLVATRLAKEALLIDATTRQILDRVSLVQQPLGLAWSEDGTRAWLSSARTDGEGSRVVELAVGDQDLRVRASHRVVPLDSRHGSPLAAANGLPEGGAVLFGAAPVPRPGTDETWLAANHLNANDRRATADSTANAALYVLTHGGAVDVENRRILSAESVSSLDWPPAALGAGWDAGVSGTSDLAFEADGRTAWVLFEHSEDLVRVPADLPPTRPDGVAALLEIPVGFRPRGLALAPSAPVAFVYNELAQTVSIVDLVGGSAWRELPIGGAAPQAVTAGARHFFTSADPRTSSSEKVSCGSCHWNGEDDGLVWSFQFGNNTGPRATLSLNGVDRTEGSPQLGLGQFHRSGDVHALVDFVCAFNLSRQGGQGFVDVPPTRYGDPGCPGNNIPQAAFDVRDFIRTRPAFERSPHRPASGALLSEAALRGWRSFQAELSPSAEACTTCHASDTAFVDQGHHDVGGHRSTEEQQLPAQQWRVNTPSLLGLFASEPHDDGGLPGPGFQDLRDLLDAWTNRAGHQAVSTLTGRQRDDLATFLLSLDGELADGALAGSLDDTTAPRLERVEAASLTRLVAWFSETVDATSAGSLANWTVLAADGSEVPVLDASREAPGDRVVLTVSLPRDCSPASYTVIPGPIRDATPGSTPETLDISKPENRRLVTVGDELTVSFGWSGRETFRVPVHDATLQSPLLAAGTDAPGLGPAPEPDGPPLRGFLSFDWITPFLEAGGAGLDDLVAAAVTLQPKDGLAQPVGLRRVLRFWQEPPTAGDGDPLSDDAPTWARASLGNTWSLPGAGRLLGTGSDPLDYDGSGDLAAVLDAVADPESLDAPLVFEGPGLLEAIRFWYEFPEHQRGWALTPIEEHPTGLTFRAAEERAGADSPTLTLTYRLPPADTPRPEVSSTASGLPLLVDRDGATLRLSFEDARASGYDLIEGAIGWPGSGTVAACGKSASASAGGRAELAHAASEGSRWFLVATSGPCGGALGGDRSSLPSPCAP